MSKKLDEYKSKRDLNATPEPVEGNSTGGDKPQLVIRKHDTSTLHYDFRLEIDGVLKSWAVPKGPSTDPSEKRLAIPTEDHPLDYAGFEGTIPKVEYGGGTVMIWDSGRFRNLMEEKDDPLSLTESLEEGHMEVWLVGDKLQGGI